MHSVAVQLQLSLVAKCSLARGTGKCKLPYLRLHVSFQVTGDESYATHTAVVGLLSSVNSYVHGKVGRVRETLATLNTIILLAFYKLFCAASVDVRMLPQHLLYVEAVVTNSAHVQVVEVLHHLKLPERHCVL